MDSASVVSSASSASSVSSRARASAKKAAMEARLGRLEQLERVEAEELRIRQKKNRLETELELAEAEAETNVYESLEALGVGEYGMDRFVGLDIEVPPSQILSDVWWTQPVATNNVLDTLIDQELNGTLPAALIPLNDVHGLDHSKQKTNCESTPGPDQQLVKQTWSGNNTLYTQTPKVSQEQLDTPLQRREKSLIQQETVPSAPPQGKPTQNHNGNPKPSTWEHNSCENHDYGSQQYVSANDLGSTFKKLVDSIRLPPVKVEKFDGDALTFPTWLVSFNALVESKACTTCEKLNLLAQHLDGEPKALVANYLLLQTSEAYDLAKTELRNRYGHSSVIANAMLTKLNSWPKVPAKDSIALRRYSDFILELVAAKQTVPDLGVLNYSQENRKMVAKLPFYLEAKWRSIVSSCMDKSCFPTIEQFSEFVKARSKEANIPMFQTLSTHHEQSSGEEKKTNKRSHASFHTKVSDASQCPYCKKNHNIDNCTSFMSISRTARKDFLFKHNLCFKCGKPNCKRFKCKDKAKCRICFKGHLTCLHFDINEHEVKGSTSSKQVGDVYNKCTTVCGDEDKCNDSAMIIPVWLKNTKNNAETLIYCILDPQSNSSFVDEHLVKEIGAQGPATKINLSTMHTSQIVESTRIKGLEVISFDRRTAALLPTVFTRECIPASRSQIPTPETASKWDHLKCIANEIYPLIHNAPVGLLIGSDVPSVIRPRDIRAGSENQPYGQKSVLGWGIIGTVCKKPPEELFCRFVNTTAAKEVLITPQRINEWFSVDFKDQAVQALSVEDKRFLKIMDESITQLPNGHYEMPLPLRNQNVQLPNNKPMALKRLLGLKRRFEKQPKFKDDYLEFMNGVLTDCAEVVPEESSRLNNGKINYIPHTGVYHPKKPRKIRVVYDCSASYQGTALNDHLLQGPNQINNLLGVLLRFRMERIALICDIKGMFHQFVVKESDRDLLRFLWFRDNNLENPVTEHRMKVHLFGAKSSPGCANYGLKRAADDGREKWGKVAAEFIRNDFYVDDGLKSVATVEEAKALIVSSTGLCADAGLHLHKWSSNNREVLNTVPENERGKSLLDLNIKSDSDTLPLERVLGVAWCIETDSFSFRVELNDYPPTRRNVLRVIFSIYDPFGFVSPVMVTGKSILQALCKQKLDWDDPLSTEMEIKWKKWCSDVTNLSRLQIPRCYKPAQFKDARAVEMHYFSDASEMAYGQCTYLRQTDIDGNVAVSFVMGKARVTPAKQKVTIPRLELAGAVLSARASEFVKSELPIQAKEYFWTDSMVILGYLQNEAKRYQVYVANRVQAINDVTQIKDWRHVQSSSNPSDIASRGTTAKQLLVDSTWLYGPQFLREKGPIDKTPVIKLNEKSSILVASELKRSCMSTCVNKSDSFQSDFLENLLKFSSWNKLRRTIAVCLIFKKRLMKLAGIAVAGTSIMTKVSNNLDDMSVQDMEVSEHVVLRLVQDVNYDNERSLLKRLSKRDQDDKDDTYLKRSSSLCGLDPFIDKDGLLRVGGRFKHSKFSFEVKHPIILPKKSRITKLLIRHYHEKISHMGKSSTLNEIRQRGYWIIKGLSAVNEIVSRCVLCRRMRGKVSTQKMADLPAERLDDQPPFSVCGVDLFGPFQIKERRSVLKRYGVLFTCLSSRAIHLESASSLETSSFINALRRFLSLRGPTRQLFCDQGTNIVGAYNEWNRADEKGIKDFVMGHNCDISFNFNVPTASHMAGVYERQIRTVRSALEPLLKLHGSQLDDEGFRTLLAEVTNIVNSRPLTLANLNDPSSLEPLTPNHILTLKDKIVVPPPGNFQQNTELYCRRRWRRVQHLAEQFWFRWKKEYIASLQTRQKWESKGRNMCVGDIVLLQDEHLPRNQWELAKVMTVFPSNDGLVRKVSVLVGRRKVLLDRPVAKLVLLLPTSKKSDGNNGNIDN